MMQINCDVMVFKKSKASVVQRDDMKRLRSEDDVQQSCAVHDGFVIAGGNVACLSSCVTRTTHRWWIGDSDKGVHAHLLVLSVRAT